MPAFFGRREGSSVFIEGGDARHLARSLRAHPGEAIDVIDPAGFMLRVKLDEVSEVQVRGTVVSERSHQSEPGPQITIAVATLPAKALDHLLSSCTEAGAHQFILFPADRSVGRGFKAERSRAICREAAMLAGRLHVPSVSFATNMGPAIARAERAVMLVRDAPVLLADVREPRDITLLVGPEGGWSERELQHPHHASLGPRNLRSETAALVGLAIALSARGG